MEEALAIAGVPAARAGTVDLAEVAETASRLPEAEAAARRADAAREEERTVRRRALLPGIELTAGIAEALRTATAEIVAAWTRLELTLGRDPGSGLSG